MALLNGLGNKVFGENFVGRKNLVRRLQEGCTSQNFSVVGLPKIGKSSLVYHSLITNKDSVRRNNSRKFIPVFIDCGPASSLYGFFNPIIEGIYNSLREVIPAEQLTNLTKNYSEYKDGVITDLSGYVLSFIKTIENYQINIVLILDEFDRVRVIPDFDGTKFALLRTILEHNFINIVTISKRSLDILEGWNEDPNHNPSNFYQCFIEIIVGNFEPNEWDEYWDKIDSEYSGCFEEHPFNKEEIKRKAFSFTGNNPYWTAFFAKRYVDSLKYELPFDETTILDEMIRGAYNPMKDFLCDDRNYRNNILDTAIQSILGPVYMTKREDITLLEKYGFLTKIESDKKKSLFGSNAKNGLYFFDNGIEKSYIAINTQFTLFLIRELNFFKVTYWKEWDDFFFAWYSLLDQLSLPTCETIGASLMLLPDVKERWDLDFKPIFGNKGFEWFSTRYNYVIGFCCLEMDKLPIDYGIINRRNRYLGEFVRMMEIYQLS